MTSANESQYYKKDFWTQESGKFVQPHYRLKKLAKIVNRTAGTAECSLLDVGCGPATLSQVLQPNIKYYGIDIAVPKPAPNLLELDICQAPIQFEDKRFDMVVAQGLFEYLGQYQSQKFSEIANILTTDGIFIVSYTNFDHWNPEIYDKYNNVQSHDSFRQGLLEYFHVNKTIPTSHNWHHSEPNRKLVKMVNMKMNLNIPVLSTKLAVSHFFICSPRFSAAQVGSRSESQTAT